MSQENATVDARYIKSLQKAFPFPFSFEIEIGIDSRQTGLIYILYKNLKDRLGNPARWRKKDKPSSFVENWTYLYRVHPKRFWGRRKLLFLFKNETDAVMARLLM